MGIVQVKIKNEDPICYPLHKQDERKKRPFRLEW